MLCGSFRILVGSFWDLFTTVVARSFDWFSFLFLDLKNKEMNIIVLGMVS
jgi:hypothetical protein